MTLVTLILLLHLLSSVNLLNFPLLHFCKLKCDDKDNSACKCTPQGRREEDLNNLTSFRRYILHRFNHYRNAVASGKGSSTNTSKASNMNVLSYDLELEYVARCYALKYVFHHDKCRQTSKFARPGQFIARFSKKPEMREIGKFISGIFRSQLERITDSTVENYSGYKSGVYNSKIDDLVQMSWWSHTHVGCARVYNPEAILEFDTYVIICNFGGIKESNLIGEPVYKKGKPCSECANNGGCNLDYTELCGVQEKLPNESIYSISRGEERFQMKFTMIFMVFVILVIIVNG